MNKNNPTIFKNNFDFKKLQLDQESMFPAGYIDIYDGKLIFVSGDGDISYQNLDTLYDQCLDNHDLIAPEIDNVKLFGQSLALLFIANLFEVTVDNFLF